MGRRRVQPAGVISSIERMHPGGRRRMSTSLATTVIRRFAAGRDPGEDEVPGFPILPGAGNGWEGMAERSRRCFGVMVAEMGVEPTFAWV